MRFLACSLFSLLFLTSCGLTRMRPGSELDFDSCETWKTPLACCETPPLCPNEAWWEGYGDACLNSLEEQAIANNYDLNIAASRILQARALVGIAFSTRVPQVNLNPSYTREEMLVTLSDFGLGSGYARVEERQVVFPLNFSYEIDFWGKYRNLEAAARERFFASELNAATVYLSLTAEVAAAYFNLRTLDEEVHYLEQAVKVREDFRDINEERLRRGLDCEIDVTRANLDLALAVTELEGAKRLRGLAENTLGLLLGYPACSFCLPAGTLPQKNLCPAPDLPSTLIARRPDIQEKMHAALAALQEIGVAKAEFFPQFSITGALGTASPNFSNLFTWQSRFWAFTVSAFQVVFDGGRLRSNLELKKAKYLENVLDYKKQVTIAFKEVEDALNEIQFRKAETASQEQAVLFSQDTSFLARHQYEAGLINYLLVADAEKTQLNARRLFIRLNGSLYLSSVQLIKALGGGFYNAPCLN